MPLPLLMLVVFGAAKLMAELFEHLNLPGIVGEILAGVIIGPSLLGWVQPDGLVLSLADLGVMFLLFRVGLEIKSSELTNEAGRQGGSGRSWRCTPLSRALMGRSLALGYSLHRCDLRKRRHQRG